MTVSDSGPVIAVADLRRALNRVLDQVAAEHGETVDLDAGNYWTVRLRDSFSFTEPVALQLGDIADDAETMTEMLQRDPDEIYPWHDLEHLMGILRRLAALDLPPDDPDSR